jgi:hypothetical protein
MMSWAVSRSERMKIVLNVSFAAEILAIYLQVLILVFPLHSIVTIPGLGDISALPAKQTQVPSARPTACQPLGSAFLMPAVN